MGEVDPAQRGMSTTASVVQFVGELIIVGQVGDSRLPRPQRRGNPAHRGPHLAQRSSPARPPDPRRGPPQGQRRQAHHHPRGRPPGVRRGRHPRRARATRRPPVACCSVPTASMPTWTRARRLPTCSSSTSARPPRPRSATPTPAAAPTTSLPCSLSFWPHSDHTIRSSGTMIDVPASAPIGAGAIAATASSAASAELLAYNTLAEGTCSAAGRRCTSWSSKKM
jgi:hypothetical protein